MKKRILSLAIATILIFSCLGLSVSATDTDIYFSDDFLTLYYNGVEYYRFDASFISYDYSEEYDLYDIKLPKNPTADSVNLSFNSAKNIIDASLYFTDNSRLNAYYIENSYLDECQSFRVDTDNLIIDFMYPEGNTVTVSKDMLYGERATIEYSDDMYYTTFEVVSKNSDGSFYFNVGSLIVVDDTEYYYVDYKEADLKEAYVYLEDHEYLSAAKVTNEELCNQIDAAMASYNNDTIFFNDIFNDQVTEIYWFVILILLFVLIPLTSLVLCLVLSLRAKTAAYKKIFTTIYIISAAELVIFAVVTLLPVLLK